MNHKNLKSILIFLAVISVLLTGCNNNTNPIIPTVTNTQNTTATQTSGQASPTVTYASTPESTETIAPTPSGSNTQNTTPVKTTPSKTTPVKTTPPKTTPPKTTPPKTTPRKTTPPKTTPPKTTPIKTPSPYEIEKQTKKDILTSNLTGKPGKILILGNSFISSSQIGSLLERVVNENGQNLEIIWYSEGFATISSLSHHIYDPGVMEGEYDAIFLCGIFSPDTAALQDFLNAVKNVKTKIILFPASNESPSDISTARVKYPGAGYCGWLDLIYEMCNTEKFPLSAMMFNDGVSHANELSGYGGAMMIYNYLYRNPPSTTEIDSYMLDYFRNYMPGTNDAQKKQSLKTVQTVAQELVEGTREYKGRFTAFP